MTRMTDAEYVQGTTRTEAILDDQTIQRIDLLKTVFYMQDQLGQLADLVKKSIYYGLPDEQIKIHDKSVQITRELTKLIDAVPEHLVVTEKRTLGTRVEPGFFRHLHSILGMITETGEMAESTWKYMNSLISFKELQENTFEEFGDAHWYIGINCDYHNFDLTEIKEKNNAKLRVRFPEKFSQEQVVNRDLEAEAQALKG